MMLLIISPTGEARFFTGYPDQSTVYKAGTHIQVMMDRIIVQAGRRISADSEASEVSNSIERRISELRNLIQVWVIEDVNTKPERIFPHESVVAHTHRETLDEMERQNISKYEQAIIDPGAKWEENSIFANSRWSKPSLKRTFDEDNIYPIKQYCPFCTEAKNRETLVVCQHWTGTTWIKNG